ncbi:MAG: mechanosensitive ion channel family protein [Acidimicrobiia bacterium]|nr:mechanosensitive ion channel family protein [Acidimicrobiia bacterium]
MSWDEITGWIGDRWTDHGGEIIATVVILLGAWVVLVIIKRTVRRWESRIESELYGSGDIADRERGQRLVTIAGVLKIVLSITLWVMVVLTIMAIWGLPMSPFIAVGTTIGVAIGFGAQDLVRDVIAGFLILLEDQYSLGDVVSIAGVTGSVESIQLRSTVLRDLEGNQHFVPNGQIKVASNLTSEFSRVVVDIPVSYETDVDQAMDVVKDEVLALAGDEEWAPRFIREPEVLGVNKLDSSAVDIRVLMTLTPDDRWLVKREFLRRIKNRLDAEGIEIPFDQVVMRMKPEL